MVNNRTALPHHADGGHRTPSRESAGRIGLASIQAGEA
jgi:hypothetical protein